MHSATSVRTRIIGIDPGYDRVGWAVCDIVGSKIGAIAYDLIQTNAKQSQLERYQQLSQQLDLVLQTYQPTEAAVESLFFATNQKTAIAVAQARGIILSRLFDHHVQVHEYTPLQVKQAVTGFGQADKKAVEKMVRLQLKNLELRLVDDTIDALALCLTLQVRGSYERASML